MPGSKSWFFLLIALTFLAGVSAGMWGEKALLARASASASSEGQRSGDWRARTLAKFTERLELSAEQSRQLEAVFEAKRKDYDEVLGPVRPRLREIREASRLEIRKLLRPEQLPEFERICQEEDERYKSWMQK